MSEQRCGTCRWWQTETDRFDEVIHPLDDDYEEIPQEFEVRYCEAPEPRLVFFKRPTRDGASLFDGSQYFARLATGPDFGCTNWAPAGDTSHREGA